MLAVEVYVRGEENPDPRATTKEYGRLFFTGVMDMVMKTIYTIPGGRSQNQNQYEFESCV